MSGKPCTMLGSPAKLTAEQWERIPANSVLLHQAESRLWPANLEFRDATARDRWESRHADIEQARDFPEIVMRESYRMLPESRRVLPAVRTALEGLRVALANAAAYSDSADHGAAAAAAWGSAEIALSKLVRIVAKESQAK